MITIFASKNNESYTQIRIFGSIAYVIGTTAGGYAIQLGGYKLCFGIATLLFILSGFFYFIIKPIDKEKVIYIDPYKVYKAYNDADLIFITHNHYDHYSEEDIDKVKQYCETYKEFMRRTKDER